MASTDRKSKRQRGRVPVAHRSSDPDGPRARLRLPAMRLSIAETAVIVLVAILILGAVAVPLRNYFQGRTDIARTTEAIAQKQEEKERLLQEVDQYQSEAYQREEARKRLGVIEEGETAFRILDPAMSTGADSAESEAEEGPREWWEVLWDSISVPSEANPAPEPLEAGEVDTHMPIEGDVP
ncbi:septum formation initiator family protein [Corynebacterium oculi]|uniref:Septum formation initiator n=1 Tax=Corynebacterium oculi TaxID=1544416 RepID=A0A0Q0YC25_9CORY|nr:septum formation initiator family protein [Corynebacterium oculi]KQB83646.1 Septum formation initiator [Corynebacterium oculi]